MSQIFLDFLDSSVSRAHVILVSAIGINPYSFLVLVLGQGLDYKKSLKHSIELV